MAPFVLAPAPSFHSAPLSPSHDDRASGCPYLKPPNADSIAVLYPARPLASRRSAAALESHYTAPQLVAKQTMNGPPGTQADGILAPLNPFTIDPPAGDPRDDEIPGYTRRFGAYHTLTEGVFLPAGTLLPAGASFAMQATVDFGLHFPKGTKVPGGFLLPVSVVKKKEQEKKP